VLFQNVTRKPSRPSALRDILRLLLKSRLWWALLLVTIAGAVAFALAPSDGRVASIMLAIVVALFVLQMGLAIADHLRSTRLPERD
jgi:hypothetical protein